MFKRVFLIFVGILCESAQAEFSASKRSINGTGETLAEGEFELGISSLKYGLNQDWMITTPSVMALLGYGRSEIRRKFAWDQSRWSPYLAAETSRKYSMGSDYGWDFGEAKSQSVTLGGRVQFTPRVRGTTHGPRSKLHSQFLPNVEYDFYTRGNVAYIGIAEYRAYLGYTWAFENWHLGLIAGPATRFVPLPYVYLRF